MIAELTGFLIKQASEAKLFMHDFDMNRLPSGSNWLFQRVGNVHNRLTRLSSTRGLHTQKFNTTTNGLSSLRYTGTKALNALKMILSLQM